MEAIHYKTYSFPWQHLSQILYFNTWESLQNINCWFVCTICMFPSQDWNHSPNWPHCEGIVVSCLRDVHWSYSILRWCKEIFPLILCGKCEIGFAINAPQIGCLHYTESFKVKCSLCNSFSLLSFGVCLSSWNISSFPFMIIIPCCDE